MEKIKQAGFDELYSTAPDAIEKKLKLLDKKIEEESVSLANQKIGEARRDKEIKAIINKFYKEIFRTPFDKLSYDQFPSFDDPMAYLLYSGLASKFERKNDDKSVSLMAITQIRLANHINDINYKDDNLDVKVR